MLFVNKVNILKHCLLKKQIYQKCQNTYINNSKVYFQFVL